MPATTTYALTGNAYIDGLLGDRKWAISDFTFSFPTSGSFYGVGYGNGEPQNGFAVLNAAQQAAARAALDEFSAVANLTFTEITESATDEADLRLASSDAPNTAWAYLPSTAAEGGDAWFNHSSGYYSSPVKGNYAYVTFLHEIGHALALEHAHEGNVMPVNRDSMEYTVMSYRSYVGASTGYTNEAWGYAQSLMMYDIAALQHMYGADFTTQSGNTTYRWSPTSGEMFINGLGQGAPGGDKVLLTVWDGGGVDTYDFFDYTTALKVDLRPGEWTTTSAAQLAKLHYSGSKVAVGNIANALQYEGDARSLIENASGGSASDTITGNHAANTLLGNDGSDVLNGEIGNDALYGGLGRDKVRGGDGNDRILGGPGKDHLSGGAGADTFVFKKLSESTPASIRCDTIYDFLPSEGDRIHLSAIDAQLGRGNQAFLFVETADFSGSYGELRCNHGTSGTYIYGDVNGDKNADFAIYLDDVITLQRDYFVL